MSASAFLAQMKSDREREEKGDILLYNKEAAFLIYMIYSFQIRFCLFLLLISLKVDCSKWAIMNRPSVHLVLASCVLFVLL